MRSLGSVPFARPVHSQGYDGGRAVMHSPAGGFVPVQPMIPGGGFVPVVNSMMQDFYLHQQQQQQHAYGQYHRERHAVPMIAESYGASTPEVTVLSSDRRKSSQHVGRRSDRSYSRESSRSRARSLRM